MPSKILDKFNLDNIELCKESYIDEDLEEQFTDVVYKAKMDSGTTGYIYMLVEHQSSASKMIPFRIVKYQIAIMQNHLLQYPKDLKLPVV